MYVRLISFLNCLLVDNSVLLMSNFAHKQLFNLSGKVEKLNKMSNE